MPVPDYMYISIRYAVHLDMEEMGSVRALKAFGEHMRERYANYATNATHYTCGVESLNECFPGRGYEWMRSDDPNSHNFLYEIIGNMYDEEISRVVECVQLQSNRNAVPYGHLGSHQENMAQYLSFPASRTWRMLRWVELWYLLQSGTMVHDATMEPCPESRTIHQVFSCRQGKHRSVGWSIMEAAVLKACGFVVAEIHICAWKQGFSTCMKRAKRRGEDCEYCRGSPETRARFGEAAVDEFFMVVLFLDASNA